MNALYSFLMIFIFVTLIGNLSSKVLQLKGVKNLPNSNSNEDESESLIFLSKNQNGSKVKLSSSYVNPYLVQQGSNDFSLHEGAKIVHQVISKPVKYPRKAEVKETKEEGFLLNNESNVEVN